MVAKELREAWWKVAAGALVFLALVVVNTTPYGMIEEIVAGAPTVNPDGAPIPEEFQITEDPVEYAMQDMAWTYGWHGSIVLAGLAALLGVSLVSREVSQGSILFLLSRPISRPRLLLQKYSVGAGLLFVVSVLGAVGLVISAAAGGYPLEHLSIRGLALSAGLIWLGSLSVLGGALLVSVVFRDVFKSVVATGVVLYLVFAFPKDFLQYFLWNESRALGISEEMMRTLSLRHYWTSESLYLGESASAPSFLICGIAAGAPLLLALWLFGRKAY